MKKLLYLIALLPYFVFGQSVDGGLKTLTATGTNTYVISEPLPAAYDPKERFLVRFTNGNSGAATLNRAALGAKAIQKAGAVALSSGDIVAGGTYLISYNGTYYQLVGDGGGGGGGSGDVVGPGSSVNNNVVFFNGTTGKLIKDSGLTLSGSNTGDQVGTALTKVDDTNVTLTLGGSPSTALLAASSITAGWTGTLADARITSSANWNTAYTNRITSLTVTGSSGASTLISNTLNIPTYTLAGLGGIASGTAWLLPSGGTATGTNTFAMGAFPFIMTTGVTTGTGATAGHQLVGNSLTTGNLFDASSTSVSTGSLGVYTSTSTVINHTAGTNGLVEVLMSGANSTASKTAIGLYSKVINTGTSSTNIAGYFEASGGTTNFGVVSLAALSTAYTGVRIQNSSTGSARMELVAESGSGLSTATSMFSIERSNGTNGILAFTNSGGGTMSFYMAGSGAAIMAVTDVNVGVDVKRFTIGQQGATSGGNARTALTATPGAHTNLTAATAFPNQIFSSVTQSWVATAGTIAAQKDTEFRAITHSAATSGTFTNLFNVYMEAPLVGGAATASNAWALGLGGSFRTDAGNVFIANASGDTPTASVRADFRGIGTAGSSFAVRIADSANTPYAAFRDDGYFNLGITNGVFIAPVNSNPFGPDKAGRGLSISLGGLTVTNTPVTTIWQASDNDGSGNKTTLRLYNVTLNPTSGTLLYRSLLIDPTYNTTGTATNTIYGIDYNPTLTSMTGATHLAFRSTSGNWAMQGSATTFTLGGGVTASELRFLEPSGSGANYTAFKAVAQGADITYSLPPTVGAAGSKLTDVAGNGVLTWVVGGGAGISNTAAADEMMKSDGTNAVPSGLFSSTLGNLNLGSVSLAGNRIIQTVSSTTNANLSIFSQLDGSITIGTGNTIGSILTGGAGSGWNATRVTSSSSGVSDVLKITHASTVSGVSATYGAGIVITGEDSADSGADYGRMTWAASDVTAASVDADMNIQLPANSSMATKATFKSTGQLQLQNYTTTTSFTGTAVGNLQFDASGNILTTGLSGGTYYAPTSIDADATNADFTAVVNSVKYLPAATLSVNRTITMPAGTNGDVIEIFNNEAGFTWLLAGGAVYLSDGTTTLASLTANTNYVIRKVSGKWRISN